MALKFSDLQCKEVICIQTGQRLGFVSDVLVELPQGTVQAIVVPGPCRMWGLAPGREDYILPWNCIQKIGPDIVLVDVKPDQCRAPRPCPRGR